MTELVEKTPAQLKKEAAKQAKLEKFQKKQEALKEAALNNEKKPKKAPPVAKPAAGPVLYTAAHPLGEKKDVTGEMPSAYSPAYVEAAWYEWWEKEGFFKPEYGRDLSVPNPKGQFMMVIPPPNVTGTLHLGHALTTAVQDTIVRWHRMRGETTLWNPGCDHAGIATQVVVEKKLMNEHKKSRHDIGREAFIKETMKWKDEKEESIYHQLRRLGGSYDWDRACFTMDPKMSRAVTEAFVRLHDKGLIFRHNRLVNWSCSLKSAISDIEVEKIEIKGRTNIKVPGYSSPVEVGIIEEFYYRVEGSEDKIIVATTRLETMLGDTAVCVHPDDKRYTHLHGKSVHHPFRDCTIPIVTDSFVDMEFGTGAVKITPAHDFNDYEVGISHKLPFVKCINELGLITDIVDKFSGMRRFDARIAVRKALQELGMYVGCKDHEMVVPKCTRSKDIVEPLLKPQWFMNCKDMANKACDKVREGELKIIPNTFEKTWYQWLDDCRDWCISRQLWWGHRIPAYKVDIVGQEPSSDLDDKSWVSAGSREEALAKAMAKYDLPESQLILTQDEDVLDTWFSSGIFPFSIFGWPDQTQDLKLFYPGTLLETGFDILFFWVARMVMMGLTLMDDLPFTEIYLHAMVRDSHGVKMSKSLGNVVDPLDVMTGISLQGLSDKLDTGLLPEKELARARAGQKLNFPNGIPECGTDAMRFALASYLLQGRDINLDVLRIEGYRKFCNKMWNCCKFSLMQLGVGYTPPAQDIINTQGLGTESAIDRWILNRANVAITDVNDGFKEYNFPKCTTAIYNFWLYDLCDVYLECSKRVFYTGTEDEKSAARSTLYTCLDIGLKLIHPFMPFISEELYQRLPRRTSTDAPSLMISPFPETGTWSNVQLDDDVAFMKSIVHTARSVKDTYLESKAKPEIYLTSTESNAITPLLGCIQDLIGCSKLALNEPVPLGTAVGVVGNRCEVFVLVKGLVDPASEINRLDVKKEKTLQSIQQLEEKIEKYTDKVPQTVRDTNQGKLDALRAEVVTIDTAIENFRKLTL